jgi:radical SAM superfamily enzyme YgiQ (UPF0313 family)
MRVVLFYPHGRVAGGTVPVSTLAANMPPVGLLSCAAVLRDAGHEVAVFDASCEIRVTDQEWVTRIAAFEPDLAGFSAITANFLHAYTICRKVKEIRERVRTVFGGVHVSWGGKELLGRYPAIDFIIAGEGEFALRDLAGGADPAAVTGLFYRNGTQVSQGPVQEKKDLCAMDDLPFPAYNLVRGFPRTYAPPLFSYPRYPGASIISSRGCVYRCDFCDRSVFRQSFRWNSPEYTAELIAWLHRDFGVNHFLFYDDLFTLNRERVARLCALLRQYKGGITFNCIVRIGHIDNELIDELKSAGCWMVNVGIESGDQEILDSFKDGLTLDAIRSDIGKLHACGLWVKGLFMMGFPGETERSMQKTIDYACSLPLKDANVTAFTPFPGAPVAERIAQLGAFDRSDTNWENMDCVNFVFIPREIGSRDTLEKYCREFIRRFYSRPFVRSAYRKMVFQSPHSYWRLIKHAPAFLRYSKGLGKSSPTSRSIPSSSRMKKRKD